MFRRAQRSWAHEGCHVCRQASHACALNPASQQSVTPNMNFSAAPLAAPRAPAGDAKAACRAGRAADKHAARRGHVRELCFRVRVRGREPGSCRCRQPGLGTAPCRCAGRQGGSARTQPQNYITGPSCSRACQPSAAPRGGTAHAQPYTKPYQVSRVRHSSVSYAGADQRHRQERRQWRRRRCRRCEDWHSAQLWRDPARGGRLDRQRLRRCAGAGGQGCQRASLLDDQVGSEMHSILWLDDMGVVMAALQQRWCGCLGMPASPCSGAPARCGWSALRACMQVHHKVIFNIHQVSAVL